MMKKLTWVMIDYALFLAALFVVLLALRFAWLLR